MSLVVLALGALLALPQAITPRVAAIEPAGGQRGTEVVVVVRGERLAETVGCLLDRPGIEVLGAVSAAADRAELRLRVLQDCPLGPHALYLRTARGCANVVLFSVSALPSVVEQRENEAPQQLPFGCVVEGVLRGDDADIYHVDVPTAGTRVTCEVEGLRLGQEALDLELLVTGPDGGVVAWVDDAWPGGKDPWCTFLAAAAGRHTITVRPAVPGEGPRGVYRLHVGDLPRPVGALPAGGQPGEEIEVQLLGLTAPPLRVRLPEDGSEQFAWVPVVDGAAAPTPIWLRVGGPGNRSAAVAADGCARLELPGAVHAVVADAGAPPQFSFAGKKGVEIEFRAIARALRSPLDPALVVRAADGRILAYNDDGNTADSVLRFSPPADGDFTVEVRDLLRVASPAHFFRLEAGPRTSTPRLTLSVQRPSLPLVNVPQGGHGGAVLLLQGVDAASTIVFDQVPAGVSVQVGSRLPGTNLVPALFSASADAPLAGAMLPIGLRTGDGAPDWRWFLHTSLLLTGRNDVPLVAIHGRRLPFATTRPVPWRVLIEAPRVPLVRGGAQQLAVTVQREKGFGARLRARPLFAPPGLGVGQVVVDANASSGTLSVEASADAPLGEFPCLLTTIARVDGAVCEHALPFLNLRVTEPWVKAEAGKARTRQGRDCALSLTLAVTQPAAAPWQANLTGLPRGVSSPVQQVAVDATSVTFPLTVAADAALGRHRGLTVELRPAGADGVPVLHRFPAGELRVDAAPAAGGR